MVEFQPHDADIVVATVVSGTESQRIKYLMTWFEYWIRFQARCGVRGAIVFDIDNTLVDDDEKRIGPVVRAYRLCQHLGFLCAIVTARPDGPMNRKETMKMLRSHGVDDWESFYMMPNSIKIKDTEHISAYKRAARESIASRHRIVANLGDMWHDLLRFPLHESHRIVKMLSHGDCGVLFPARSHGEVAIKLIAHID